MNTITKWKFSTCKHGRKSNYKIKILIFNASPNSLFLPACLCVCQRAFKGETCGGWFRIKSGTKVASSSLEGVMELCCPPFKVWAIQFLSIYEQKSVEMTYKKKIRKNDLITQINQPKHLVGNFGMHCWLYYSPYIISFGSVLFLVNYNQIILCTKPNNKQYRNNCFSITKHLRASEKD